MKKVILIIVAIVYSTLVFAQKMTEIKTSQLPKATTDFIATNLPGTTIFKAVKCDDKGTITYNVAVDVKGKKHIYLFDKDGNFMKKGDNPAQEQKAPAKAPAVQQAPKK